MQVKFLCLISIHLLQQRKACDLQFIKMKVEGKVSCQGKGQLPVARKPIESCRKVVSPIRNGLCDT